MRNFVRIAEGQDTLPLLLALARHDELWNADRLRTTFPNSPHAEVDDILVRFEDLTGIDLAEADRDGFDAPREWMPAWDALPQIRPILGALMARVGAYELARVLITRLRPGGVILPHADVRGAYANLPDIARYHVALRGEPGSMFRCGEETVCMRTGEVWWFNARQVHEVANNSPDDRIHLLIDVRVM